MHCGCVCIVQTQCSTRHGKEKDGKGTKRRDKEEKRSRGESDVTGTCIHWNIVNNSKYAVASDYTMDELF